MRKKMDYILLIDIIMLVIFGLLMVFSASNVVANYKYSDAFYYFKRQLIFGFVGIFLMYVISRIDLKKIYKQYADSGDIISQAQRLRHSNPLAHASSELLDGVTSTTELKESVERLWSLLITYADDSNNLEFVK